MALDIGTEGMSPRTSEPAAVYESFDDYFSRSAGTIAMALGLACNDDRLASDCLEHALTAAAQRWHRLEVHPNPVGWTLGAALTEADRRSKSGTEDGEAGAGGYSRGLEFDVAIDGLPLMQRAALVAVHHLGWSDDHTAVGFGTTTEAVATRRRRAIDYLAHHVRLSPADVEERIDAHFLVWAERPGPTIPRPEAVRRRGRLRTVRNRVLTAVAVIAAIVGGAAVVAVERDEPGADAVQAVAGPTISNEWLGPVSDGAGGFVALNRSGASRFVGSETGVDWFEAAVWNSRAVHLRSLVADFVRTGDRYLAAIELRREFSGMLPPFIASSQDLADWRVEQLDIEEPDEIDGLLARYEVAVLAASGDTVLVTVRLVHDIDFRALRLSRGEVCIESTTNAVVLVTSCDGSVIRVERPDDAARAMFFVSDDRGPFERVDVPDFVGDRNIAGFGGGFIAADSATGVVSVSVDGRTWFAVDAPESGGANRYVLIEGSSGDEALVVSPNAAGWMASLLAIDATQEAAEPGVAVRRSTETLPLELDPRTVWSVPDTAVGPAGWAMFVTTSRPWERGDVTPGWAVDTGDWVVHRLPDDDVITAEAADGSVTHRVAVDAPQVSEVEGTVELRLPAISATTPSAETVQVTVTADEIARSRAVDEDTATAWVLFSETGLDWRVLWESAGVSWFGNVVVGDDEVLIQGVSLTGGSVTVPIDGTG